MAEVVAKGDIMVSNTRCVCVGTFVGDDGQTGQVLLEGDVTVPVLVEDRKDPIQEKAVTKAHRLLKVRAVDVFDGALLPADAAEVEPAREVCGQGGTRKG